MLKCLSCGREFLYAAKRNATVPDTDEEFVSIETHVCPFCENLNITEVEKTEPQIESIIKVSYEEADAKLKEGYEVKDTYAASVTLIKKAKEEKP